MEMRDGVAFKRRLWPVGGAVHSWPRECNNCSSGLRIPAAWAKILTRFIPRKAGKREFNSPSANGAYLSGCWAIVPLGLSEFNVIIRVLVENLGRGN
jgi:hypothetical protein